MYVAARSTPDNADARGTGSCVLSFGLLKKSKLVCALLPPHSPIRLLANSELEECLMPWSTLAHFAFGARKFLCAVLIAAFPVLALAQHKNSSPPPKPAAAPQASGPAHPSSPAPQHHSTPAGN